MPGSVGWLSTHWVGGEGRFKDCKTWGARGATMTMSPFGNYPPLAS